MWTRVNVSANQDTVDNIAMSASMDSTILELKTTRNVFLVSATFMELLKTSAISNLARVSVRKASVDHVAISVSQDSHKTSPIVFHATARRLEVNTQLAITMESVTA